LRFLERVDATDKKCVDPVLGIRRNSNDEESRGAKESNWEGWEGRGVGKVQIPRQVEAGEVRAEWNNLRKM